MRRREFLVRTATAAGVSWLSSQSILRALADQTLGQKFSASDTVTLGSTGIKTSRLAMGTGTVGSGHHSHQTALGIEGLSDLLRNGYDHGLRFFDSADSYGSHPHVAEALKHVPRDKVTVLTKYWARDASGMRADLDRFRKELGTDYVDIWYLHAKTSPAATLKPTLANTSRPPRRQAKSAAFKRKDPFCSCWPRMRPLSPNRIARRRFRRGSAVRHSLPRR